MRDLINIIENQAEPHSVSIDMLPASVKADILDMCLGPNGPKAFEEFWVSTHGIMSFDESYVSQFLFGDENLNVTGEYGGDTIRVNELELDPRVLFNDRRSVSDLAVGKYAALSTTAPPVLARRTPSGWKLVEGGHRVAAAVRRQDVLVNVVDVSAFFDMTIEDWASM